MFIVLGLFALPTLADSCADQKAALVQQAKQLQAEMNQFNSRCGGTLSRSEYEARQCRPWGARLDAWNARLDQEFKELARRCK
jgi:hypothetical protein